MASFDYSNPEPLELRGKFRKGEDFLKSHSFTIKDGGVSTPLDFTGYTFELFSRSLDLTAYVSASGDTLTLDINRTITATFPTITSERFELWWISPSNKRSLFAVGNIQVVG